MSITTIIHLVIFIACIAIAFVLVMLISDKLSSLIGSEWKGFSTLINIPVVGDVAKVVFGVIGWLGSLFGG
jgi:dolichol kinase